MEIAVFGKTMDVRRRKRDDLVHPIDEEYRLRILALVGRKIFYDSNLITIHGFRKILHV